MTVLHAILGGVHTRDTLKKFRKMLQKCFAKLIYGSNISIESSYIVVYHWFADSLCGIHTWDIFEKFKNILQKCLA